MALNKSAGNMYDFVTHTWNTVKGLCPHGCSYCYMKRWGTQNPVRFDAKELRTDLGKGILFLSVPLAICLQKIFQMRGYLIL